MQVLSLTIIAVAALATGCAAAMSLVGADYVRAVADRVRVPQWWMVPLGALLAAGSLGLVAGIFVPAVGRAAATGLVLYFAAAVGAHVRARDTQVGGAIFFLALAAGALAVGLLDPSTPL